MKFSVGIEYALHCLLFLVSDEEKSVIAVNKLSEFQGISETYLSKTFTKLKKAGIVRSSSGVKGGYELAKRPEDISFWDVIEAIEGSAYMFQCTGILKNMVINTEEEKRALEKDCPCMIKDVMYEAEEVMRNYLRSKNLRWLSDSVNEIVPNERAIEIQKWFEK